MHCTHDIMHDRAYYYGVGATAKDEEGANLALLSITGRSFLYRQILSMVGLVVGVVSGALPRGYLAHALSAPVGLQTVAPATIQSNENMQGKKMSVVGGVLVMEFNCRRCDNLWPHRRVRHKPVRR